MHRTTELLKCVFGGIIHAKEDVMLRTHAQVLTYSVQIGADVFALDISSARGWWEQASEDRPKRAQNIELILLH